MIFFSSLQLHGQVEDHFSGSTLMPIWEGDVNDFVIDDGRLRLEAPPDQGMSVIYASIGDIMTEMEWNLDFELTFNPSNQNNLRLWIIATNPTSESQDGYLLSMGESGSDDAIEILQYISGDEILLNRGTEGAVSETPKGSLIIKRTADGMVTAEARYDGLLSEEIIFSTENIEDAYFIIECQYTSTRADRFFFDNFYAGPVKIDSIPPELTAVNPSEEELILTFSESLDEASINESNIQIQPEIELEEAVLTAPSVITIVPSVPFQSGIEYSVGLSNISDQPGNVIDTTFQFFITPPPSEGDLILNEVLFNPRGSGTDYVEIKNISNKELSLQNLYLRNESNGQNQKIEAPMTILPNEIIVWAEDVDNVLSEYFTSVPSQLYEQDIPSYNNDDGNVNISTMTNGEWLALDSYDYDEKDHLLLLDEEDGVSLERINPLAETNDPSNWTSASSEIGFGTPGAENSTFGSSDSPSPVIEVTNSVFSPDGDGVDDLAEISYDISAGYIGNAAIYDLTGRKILDIWQNSSLPTRGTITWDGYDQEGQLSGIGIYVIVIDLFNLKGDTFRYKDELIIGQL